MKWANQKDAQRLKKKIYAKSSAECVTLSISVNISYNYYFNLSAETQVTWSRVPKSCVYIGTKEGESQVRMFHPPATVLGSNELYSLLSCCLSKHLALTLCLRNPITPHTQKMLSSPPAEHFPRDTTGAIVQRAM